MKTSHLFSASLIVATAWAGSEKPYSFFAKEDGKLVRLFGTSFPEFGDIVNLFSYGGPSASPAEFGLTADNRAVAADEMQSAVSFMMPFFLFGKVDSTPLQLERDNKVVNGQFYSCNLNASDKVTYVFYRNFPSHRPCKPVDVYFLHYDKSTGTAEEIEVNYDEGLDKNKVGRNRHDPINKYTLAFFAKVGDKYMPLTRNAYPEVFPGIRTLSYKDFSSEAAEFIFESGYAIGLGEYFKDIVGFHDGLLSVDSTIQAKKLKIDYESKVHDSKYYSCPEANGRNVIRDTQLSENCFEVDIYFLPYDKEAGTAVDTSEEHQTDSVPVTGNLPYVLFANMTNTMVPLGSQEFTSINGVTYSIVCHGNHSCDTVEFDIKGQHAISINTKNNGFLGIRDKILSYGRDVEKVDLELDENRKVLNDEYYSCRTKTGIQIISTYPTFASCSEVEIYLLLHDTGAANAFMKKLASEDESAENFFVHVTRTQEERDFWDRSSSAYETTTKPWQEQTPLPQPKDEMPLKEYELSSSVSKAQGLQFGFFVKIDGAMVPLSAKQSEDFGDNSCVMFYKRGVREPVEFTLEQGKFPRSLHVRCEGYVGLTNGAVTIVYRSPSGALAFARDGRVINTAFYSCWSNPVSADVISDQMLHEDCFKVDLYFLGLDRDSGKPILNSFSPEPVRDQGYEKEAHDVSYDGREQEFGYGKEGNYGPYVGREQEFGSKNAYVSESKSVSEDESELDFMDNSMDDSMHDSMDDREPWVFSM